MSKKTEEMYEDLGENCLSQQEGPEAGAPCVRDFVDVAYEEQCSEAVDDDLAAFNEEFSTVYTQCLHGIDIGLIKRRELSHEVIEEIKEALRDVDEASVVSLTPFFDSFTQRAHILLVSTLPLHQVVSALTETGVIFSAVPGFLADESDVDVKTYLYMRTAHGRATTLRLY